MNPEKHKDSVGEWCIRYAKDLPEELVVGTALVAAIVIYLLWLFVK